MTATWRRHVLVHGNLLSLDPTLESWIKSLEHTKGIPCMIRSMQCLELVLAALTKAPFEPIATCPLKYLIWKTAFLLAITSARRASEMHALSCKAPYLRFSNAGVKFTRLGFLPKVRTKVNMFRPIFVLVMHNQEDWALCRYCVKHALNENLR